MAGFQIKKQLFWNSKVSCRFIDILQPTISNVKLLQCHCIFLTSLSFFLPLLCDDLAHQIPFQEALHTPSASGTGTLVSPPLMLKHQTAVYFPPPHKWIIPCSEIPHHAGTSSSICFRNQFAVSQMSQVTTGSYLQTYVTMKIIKTPQRHSNIENLCIFLPSTRPD